MRREDAERLERGDEIVINGAGRRTYTAVVEGNVTAVYTDPDDARTESNRVTMIPVTVEAGVKVAMGGTTFYRNLPELEGWYAPEPFVHGQTVLVPTRRISHRLRSVPAENLAADLAAEVAATGGSYGFEVLQIEFQVRHGVDHQEYLLDTFGDEWHLIEHKRADDGTIIHRRRIAEIHVDRGRYEPSGIVHLTGDERDIDAAFWIERHGDDHVYDNGRKMGAPIGEFADMYTAVVAAVRWWRIRLQLQAHLRVMEFADPRLLMGGETAPTGKDS